MAIVAYAQESPRANIVPYADENDIEKLKYKDSPYYVSLNGGWKREENDTAVTLTKEIEVPKAWKNYYAYLNLRTSATCRLEVDAAPIASASDSRLWHEFDLTPHLKFGKRNTLTVRIVKHSEADLLESETIRTCFDIDGAVFITLKPETHVRDYTLLRSYQHRTSTASITLLADLHTKQKKGRYYLEVELWDPQGHQFDKMGKWVLFDKRSDNRLSLSANYASVQPWTAETPNLYTVVMRLRDENMKLIETVGTRFGFRSVEVTDGLLRLNGVPITLKGAVYCEPQIEGEATYIRMRQDLLQMKRYGFNAIRTAYRSPASPEFYELCDQLGFYVVCDANLQPYSTKAKAVATDRDFSPAFVQRVTGMYGQLKNHTSIIAWSLGPGRDNGICMDDAYKSLKAIEKSRPILYSGALYSDNTDVIATANPTTDQVREFAAKQQTRPMIILAYDAASATFSSTFDELWTLVHTKPNVQGCFLDSWLPVSTFDVTTSTTKKHGGLVTETRKPLPILPSLRYLFRTYDIRMVENSADQGEFEVRNTSDFSSMSNLILEYTVRTNHKPRIVEGDLPLTLGPGESESFKLRLPQLTLYADEELFITFTVKQRQATAFSPAGTIVGTTEFPLVASRVAKKAPSELNRSPLKLEKDATEGANYKVSVSNFAVEFDSATCALRSYSFGQDGKLPLPVFSAYELPQSSGTLASSFSMRDPYCLTLEHISRFGTSLDVYQSVEIFQSGDIIYTTEIPQRKSSSPYCVVSIPLPESFDTLEWFGRSLCSHFGSSPIGTIDHNKLPIVRFADTTDGARRTETRWLALTNQASGLYIEIIDKMFDFAVEDNKLLISVKLDSDTTSVVRLHYRAFDTYENAPYDFYRTVYPQHKSTLPAQPTIVSNKVRFDSPMTITITSPDQESTLRYTIDGSDPTASSPLYTTPFSIENTTLVKARAFSKDGTPSFTVQKHFSFDYVQAVSYSRKPNTPYNKNADKVLFDGETGVVTDLAHGWLGFSGTGVEIVATLSKKVDVEQVELRFAHNPNVWVFAPTAVEVSVSVDGTTYSLPVPATIIYNPAVADMEEQVVKLAIPIESEQIQFIKINIATLPHIPDWHRAKGLKPWLLTDEITVIESLKQ
ncbi:MAG: chitobiase/beta-hexosaminidase C-terminal domain-containing protein [Bacteroidales bacterium]|nr:chitobiase/beta-hexosaminidase C-terminal domain-containing protein [Bacteroidales bacterium]